MRRRFRSRISVSVDFARRRPAVARRKRSIGKLLLIAAPVRRVTPPRLASAMRADPPPPGEGVECRHASSYTLRPQPLVAAVAHRLLAAALAGAEPDLLGFVG